MADDAARVDLGPPLGKMLRAEAAGLGHRGRKALASRSMSPLPRTVGISAASVIA